MNLTTLHLILRSRYATMRSERAASLVEYALLIALIAVVCIVAVAFFGSETSRSFSSTANSVANA